MRNNKALQPSPGFPMSANLLEDLEIAKFLQRYFDSPEKYITCDPQIIEARNNICTSLLNNKDLTAAIEGLYESSIPLTQTASVNENEPILVIRRMLCIYKFYEAAMTLVKTIDASENLPDTFSEISNFLVELLEKKYPAELDGLWEKYANGAEITGSMSYQINFSKNLTIDSLALTSVHSKKYVKSNIFNRTTGRDRMRADSLLVLVPGHHSEMAQLIDPNKATTQLQRFSIAIQQILSGQTASVMNQLIHMERGIANEIREFSEELRFTIGLVKCAQNMKLHLPHVSFASISSSEEGLLYAQKMVHPFLAEKVTVVPNNVSIGRGRELILLGGTNRGGKTTYLRTMGVVQLLFQIGLPVPAAKAEISPASGVFCVFSRGEDTELYQGKLGIELTELRDVISIMGHNSMFLGNEPISGTSPLESYLLSKEALCILKAKCGRGIWVTHLYELFGDTTGLNEMDFGSRFNCMHVESANGGHNYVVLPGNPTNYSGAREVYEKM